MIFLGTLAVAACVASVSGSLRIAAFNVETFGRHKLSQPDVVSVLVKVVHSPFSPDLCMCIPSAVLCCV